MPDLTITEDDVSHQRSVNFFLVINTFIYLQLLKSGIFVATGVDATSV